MWMNCSHKMKTRFFKTCFHSNRKLWKPSRPCWTARIPERLWKPPNWSWPLARNALRVTADWHPKIHDYGANLEFSSGKARQQAGFQRFRHTSKKNNHPLLPSAINFNYRNNLFDSLKLWTPPLGRGRFRRLWLRGGIPHKQGGKEAVTASQGQILAGIGGTRDSKG